MARRGVQTQVDGAAVDGFEEHASGRGAGSYQVASDGRSVLRIDCADCAHQHTDVCADCLVTFLDTAFAGGRHARRVAKLS